MRKQFLVISNNYSTKLHYRIKINRNFYGKLMSLHDTEKYPLEADLPV